MDRDSHGEDTLSTLVLENIKNKLIHAFRATAESRGERQDCSVGRSQEADEELRRAQIDGAITWLRWRCGPRTCSWLRPCWGSAQRSKD
ncbi:uncharacterized protein si:ch211-153f2.3 isoform X2 [Kryptolebias marmoratus]|uniref:uncharacterized protein si:ch211-153f2.3 isoform X2 n=1 Tax=Kryptolebias marmoratus TaxID=37003 RepID=UPI0018ACE11A|nr:uncharacterized protein si:ch211-153f2.3 isoform X2 [Kryptolebias marmoratus]